MNTSLWELAGPRLLVRRIGEATGAGKSIVLVTQQAHKVPELGRQLASCLKRSECPIVHIEPLSEDPIVDLLSIIPGVGEFKTMRTVFERLSDRTLVVAPDKELSAWSEFMVRFQHAARSYSVIERPRIILVRAGSLPVFDEIILEYHEWDTVVSTPDIESLVQAWLPSKIATGVLRRVLVRTIVEICLSDVDLVREMCALSRGDIANPIGFLEEWGREHGPQIIPIWIDGLQRSHVLKDLTANNFRRHVHNRLWKAQASVLLPWVEEQRQIFLPMLDKILPEKDNFGVPRSEFEIGPVCYWLKTRFPTHHLMPLFDRCRKIRNHMAHLGFFSFDELYADIAFIGKYRAEKTAGR